MRDEVIAIGESSRRIMGFEELFPVGSRRKVLVGMKLNTSCREMLTWTIAKLAQPGDHILALHVSSLPSHQGTTIEEDESHKKQLANTLRGVLSVYESLCNLKQITLQLEIVSGHKVRSVLVEAAASYEACKLILGTNKALGRYCLKRLPCTCTVVVLAQGEIVFDKRGCLGTDMTRLDMMKALRRGMRIGRSKKKLVGRQESRSSEVVVQPSDPVMSFGSCSLAIHEDFANSPMSVLPGERRNSTSGFDALRISFSKRRAQGTLRAAQLRLEASSEVERSDMFLLLHIQDPDAHDADSSSDSEDAIVPGWPLLNNTIGFDKNNTTKNATKKKSLQTPTTVDLSVVEWALQIPSRRRHYPQEFTETKLKPRARDPYRSLAQEVDSLCSNRSCTAFAFDDLDAATSRFSQENVVGRGGGSEVFRGTLRDGRVVAVKRLNPGSQAEEELLIDVEINTTLAHAHVVSLLGYCVDAPHMLLVFDYLPQGNLEDHLHAPGKDAAVLPWEVRHRVAVGVARALEYLHKGCARPVVHRDVKTSNVLLTANFESQLSDFGLAKWAPTKASHLLCNDVVGTFGYLAPEYFMYGRVNDKTDVYALGVVLLELITGRKPIDTTRPKGEENLVNWARPLLVEKALNRLVDPLLGGVYDVAQMNNMLLAAFLSIQQSAQRRPQMSQMLEILSGDHKETLSTTLLVPAAASEEVMSTSDPDEVDDATHIHDGSDETNIRSHLALAMMGVDDDATSQCSVVDIPHSNKYLEEYLQGRFSRSASFED